MGKIEYAVISFPESLYREEISEKLGAILHLGIVENGIDGQQMLNAFLDSGLAKEFELQNPPFVAGKSALELLHYLSPWLNDAELKDSGEVYPTPEYWLGWILGLYQTESGKPYQRIFETLPYDELQGLYWPLHEAPESKTFNTLDELLADTRKRTQLAIRRQNMGITQAELARLSGVHLRSIQMYEQGNKNINHASAETVYRLAFVLGCHVEDLLER